MKIMKSLEISMRLIKIKKKRNQYEKHETNENRLNPCENHENQESPRNI